MGYKRFIGEIKNDLCLFPEEETKHLKANRIKLGEKVEVNDLNGNIYITEIIEIGKNSAKGKVLKKIEAKEEDLTINLYQCMPNQLSKIDDLIDSISELGVTKLIPVLSEYSAVKERDVIKKISKWKKKALHSIKQCKRLYPIVIENPIKINDIQTEDTLKIVFYEKEKEKTLKGLIGTYTKNISVVIGPEGGLSEKDIKILKNKGFIPITMGKNILKMETAVITGICQIKFLFG
ncbi:RsmE family RNA methyltransferase [Persephonella sp.]